MNHLRLVLFLTVFYFNSHADDFEAMIDDLLEDSVPQISAAELSIAESPLLLDTRKRAEFDVSHLAGAKWVGFQKFDLAQLESIPRDTPIVTYCSVGKRSEIIGEKLIAAGFSKVRNLRGGLFQWANEGRPLVNRDGTTRSVHPYSRKWGKWLDESIRQEK